MVKNACSTLVAFFAEVSKNGIDSWSANSYKYTDEDGSEKRVSGSRSFRAGKAQDFLTFAAVYSTTFLLVKSDLLPTRSLLTPSDAYLSISCSHCLTLVKVSAFQ